MPKAQIQIAIPVPATNEDSTSRACAVLGSSVSTCKQFLRLFDEATKERGQGTTSDGDQDLLRAMLLFACAGLDSAVSHLMRDCAVEMLPLSRKLQEETQRFASQQLGLSKDATKFLVTVLEQSNPSIEHFVVRELMNRETRHSLQSHEELMRMCSLFELSDQTTKRRILELKEALSARNVIAHEMDVNFGGPKNRSRTSRKRGEMVGYTVRVLEVASTLISSTQTQLM